MAPHRQAPRFVSFIYERPGVVGLLAGRTLNLILCMRTGRGQGQPKGSANVQKEPAKVLYRMLRAPIRPPHSRKAIRRQCMRAWILAVVGVVGLISLPAQADHRHWYPRPYVRPYVGFSYGYG